MFAIFFSDTILKLHSALKSSSTVSSLHIPSKNTPTIRSSFPLVSEDEVSKIISHSSNSFSDLDPIPTFLLKQCLTALLLTSTNVINRSLVSCTFPDHSKLVLSFLFSRKTILTKKTSPTIDLSLNLPCYLNLLSVLLRTVLLLISLQIISSIRINLPTPSIILLSLLFLLFTTTSLSL